MQIYIKNLFLSKNIAQKTLTKVKKL